MPACDRVIAVNTPTTYRWISALSSPWNSQTKTLASTVSDSTPFENTSRSPRFRNCDGMNRSRARIDARRGKSWYAVFAARTRIAAVSAWRIQNGPVRPNTVSPICDSTDRVSATCSFTRTSSIRARSVMPRNMGMLIAPMSASVVAAFLYCGGLERQIGRSRLGALVEASDETEDQRHEHHRHEAVGRQREQRSGLAHTT